MNKTSINNSLFVLNPIPSWVYDYETLEVLDVNLAAIKHYGYSREEFLSLTLKDLRPPQEVPKLINAHIDIKNKEGNIYFGIFTHQKKNGNLIRMEINGHKVDFEKRHCMLVVCQDVTEKEDQLRMLQDSEAKLKTATSIAKLGYWTHDIKSKKLTWSDEVYNIWCVDRDTFELTYDNFFKTIHPDDQDAYLKEQKSSLTEKQNHDFIYRIICPDSSIRWVHELGQLVKDESGKVISFEGTVQDITAQKEEEQRLKLLESVIIHTNDAIVITEAEPQDEPGPRIIYVNEAFTKMTGYKAEEVIGKTPRILQGPNSDYAELARMGKALRNWESCEITTINYKKNGEEFWLNFSVSPVANDKGWYTHWISIERDVTEQKQKEIEKELLSKISLNFSFENDLVDATTALCKTINDYGRFDFVELWLPTLDNKTIQLFAHESATSKADIFYESSKDIKSFLKGEGLPGIAWDKKATLLWDDIRKKDDFVRKVAAQKAGITSAMGIPLRFNDQTLGVLVVATKQKLSYLKKYVKLFEQFEYFIGSEINRKKLEKDLQHLYDAIPDIVCITDLQGRFLKINKAGCDLIGQNEEDILNNTFEKFVHPDDKDNSYKDLEKLKKGGKTYGFENRYINKSGDIIWLSWTSNSNLQEGLIYATARNITEEKKLRELNRQTRELAKVGGWEYDKIENKLFWSDEVHQLHETNPNSFVPDVDRAIDFYKEEHKPFVADKIKESLTKGVYLDYEAVIITLSKKERWIRVIATPEYIDGKCVKFVGSFQDITERKEAEARLQSLSDNMPGVVFQYLLYPDGTDTLRNVSKGSEKIFGYSPEAIEKNIDLVWNQVKAGGDYETVKQSVIESVEKKAKWYIRSRIVTLNGEKRILQGLGTPEFLPDGTVLFNSVVLDVTQESKNEELLELATDLARIGSWELDLINSKLNWSEMVHELHETDPESFQPELESAISFYREDFRDMVKNEVAESIENGIPFDFEAIIITANKHERWIRSIGNSEMVDGKCQRVYGSFQDIHSEKISALELEKSLKRLNDFKYSLDESSIIAYTDKFGIITSVNDNFCKISKYKKEELIGKTHRIINSKHHSKAFFTGLWKTISSGNVWRGEIKNKAKDGSYYWVYTTIVPFLDENNEPFQYLAIRFDITNQKKAEESAFDLLKQRNNILESISDAFYSLDKNWNITYFNKEAENLLKRKSEEVLGKNLWKEFALAKGTKLEERYRNVAKTGKLETFEYWYPGDGSWYEINAYPFKGGVSAFFKNIDNRKKAEEELQKAYDEKHNILESIGDAFFAVDKNWVVTYWNKEAENLVGRKREDLIGKNLWDLFPDVIDKDFYHQYHLAMETGEIVSFEKYHPTLKKWFEVATYPSEKGLSVYFKDVTLRKEADVRLLQANERFEKVTEATNDAIWDYDVLNNHLFWGKGFYTLFGYNEDETKPSFDLLVSLIHEEDREHFIMQVNKYLADPKLKDWHEEYRFLKADGSFAFVVDRAKFLRDNQGKVIRVIGAMSDVTEQKKYEAKIKLLNESLEKKVAERTIALQEVIKELETFSYTVSHDLQGPLRSINSFSRLLLSEYKDKLDATGQEFLHFIDSSAKRMSNFIRELLDFAKMGKEAIVKKEVDMNILANVALDEIKHSTSDFKAKIIFGDLKPANADPGLIRQVFSNLIGNAVKYSAKKEQPVVEIGMCQVKDEEVYFVKDNGAGFDMKYAEKLFGVFQRLHHTDEFDGTGVGLATVHRIITKHGGRIWAEAEKEIGATFYFTLP